MGDGGRENQDINGSIHLCLEDAPSSSKEGRKVARGEGGREMWRLSQ